MDETTQFNMRISKSLLWDLDYIAEHRKVNRNDWLRYKIADMISTEVMKIKESAQREYAAGRISEEEFEKRMGFKPPKELKEIRENALGFRRQYMESLIDKVEKERKTSPTEKKLDKLSKKEFADIWEKIKDETLRRQKKNRKKKK